MPDEQLAPNFMLSELVQSETAFRRKIPNDPTPEQVVALRALATELLQPVRALVGPLKINSGLRQPDVNVAVGGSATSVHRFGFAADLVPVKAGVSLRDVVEAVVASTIKFDQVIYEGTWIHLGLRSPSGLQRRRALMYFGKSYADYDESDPRVAA